MKRFIIPAVAAVVLVFVSSCSSFKAERPGAYLSVIPDNPAVMLKVNANNILQESEILQNPVIRPLLAASSNGMPNAAGDLLRKIVENPAESGLDLKEPVVLALTDVSPAKSVLAVAVSDKAKLEEMLLCLSGGGLDIVDDGDVCVIETGQNDISVAFDDVRLVFALSETGADALEYMRLQGDKAVDNKEYLSFFCSDDDAAMYVSGARVYEYVANDPYFRYNARHLDDIEILKEINAFLTLNFEKGLAELAMDVDAPEGYAAMYDKYMRPSSKEHLEFVPEDAFLVLDAGSSLESLNETLSDEEKSQLSAGLASLGLDMSLFKSISGDLTFALLQPELSGREEMPQLMAVIDCSDPAVFSSILNLAGMLLKPEMVEDGVYDLNIVTAGYDYYMAYKENMLLVLPENIYASIKSGDGIKSLSRNMLDNRHAKSMGNGALVDFASLSKALRNEPSFKRLNPVLSALECARLETESATRTTLRVIAKDKETSFLKQAVDKAIEMYLTLSLD